MGWDVRVVDVTGSTNADLAVAARAGERGPTVLAAREQTAGRGRLGRSWQSPRGASLSVSVLWGPAVPQAAWTWLPAVVGLGVLDAVAALGGPVGVQPGAVALKWPNDVVVVTGLEDDQGHADGTDGAVLVGARTGLAKLAGLLAEVAQGPEGPVVVLGAGVNLARPPAVDDHEGPGAASTASLAAVLGRDVTLDEVLPVLVPRLRDRLERWEDARGDAVAAGVAADYRRLCTTVGRQVRATTPGGVRTGVAVDVATDGSLVLDGPDGLVAVSAGDVEHVR